MKLSYHSLRNLSRVVAGNFWNPEGFLPSGLATNYVPTAASLNHYHYHTTACPLMTALGRQGRSLNSTWSWSRRSYVPKPQLQTRVPRWKVSKKSTPDHEVTAYALGEKLDLVSLTNDIVEENLYYISKLPDDLEDMLHLSPRYADDRNPLHRDIFIFQDGAIVFWGVSAEEQSSVLKTISKRCMVPYKMDLVSREKESLEFQYVQGPSNYVKGEIHLNQEVADKTELLLQKFPFCNALSQSVQLGVLETQFESIADICEKISERLKKGENIGITFKKVMVYLGQLYTLRHAINLESEIFDTPDVYWDRDDLDVLYNKCSRYLSLQQRAKVMNMKIGYCIELLELIKALQDDKRHTFLEKIIIFLIAMEVIMPFLTIENITSLVPSFNKDNWEKFWFSNT